MSSNTIPVVIVGSGAHKAVSHTFPQSVGWRLGEKLPLQRIALHRTLTITVAGTEIHCPWRSFSPDSKGLHSWGWHVDQTVTIGGQDYRVNGCLIVVHSKLWKDDVAPTGGEMELSSNLNVYVSAKPKQGKGKAAKKVAAPSAAQSVAPAPAPAQVPAADMLPEFPADCPF